MELSGPVWDFYRLMGAVLTANLLTVAFVWAAFNYSRREQLGIEKEKGSGVYIGVMLMVCAFLLGGLFAAGMFGETNPFVKLLSRL